MTCIGPSMSPTIKLGDVITVVPYGSLRVRRGDVLVFRVPGGERMISHRVVKVSGRRLTVRGDNNGLEDPWRLSLEDVVGRVAKRARGRKIRSLAGGRAGALLGGILRSTAVARLTLFRIFRPVYL